MNLFQYVNNMNYSFDDIPFSGENPVVYMDISLNGTELGRIHIRMYRDVFPAGVENFVKIAAGNTYRITKKNSIFKQFTRSYTDTKFFHSLHNNYIVGGDIYNNDGSSAGTVYNDEPIPGNFGEYYYPHDEKGMVSLVPFIDEKSGRTFYDSTFMITLDDRKPSNLLNNLDKDQIVIGKIYSGIDIIDKMNKMLVPYAKKKYPKFVITKSGVIHSQRIKRNNPISKR